MKKIVSLAVVAALAVGAAACSKTETANNTAENAAVNEVAPVEGNLVDNSTVDANSAANVDAATAGNGTDANASNATVTNSTNAN